MHIIKINKAGSTRQHRMKQHQHNNCFTSQTHLAELDKSFNDLKHSVALQLCLSQVEAKSSPAHSSPGTCGRTKCYNK